MSRGDDPRRGLRPAADARAADWWLDQLDDWGRGGVRVGALVPSAFGAVAHVLHPWRRRDHTLRWSEVRDRLSPSGVAQFDQTPDGFATSVGELDDATARTLVESLAHATSTPNDVFVAVWEGWGDLRLHGRDPAHIDTAQRGHVLWRGGLADVLEPGIFDRDRVAAGIWWPRDRDWFLVTEIDLAWTFVAGDVELIDRLVEDPELEATRTAFDAPANRVPDGT